MKNDVVRIECVTRRISYLRGQKAILNRDLALETNREWAQRSSNVETRVGQHDDEIAIIEAARQLSLARDKTQREIGFHVPERSPRDGTGKRR
jgi:hypothetical protein